MGREIKVIIVDESAVVRQVMVQVLSRDPEIRIIAPGGQHLVVRRSGAQYVAERVAPLSAIPELIAR
jgi:hypothetical protein